MGKWLDLKLRMYGSSEIICKRLYPKLSMKVKQGIMHEELNAKLCKCLTVELCDKGWKTKLK